MVFNIIKRHKGFLFALSLSFLTYVIFFGQFLTPSHYFWSSADQQVDAQTEYVPARVYFYDKIVKEHVFPFWTEKMYSGFPIYADLENTYLNPINDASILIFGPWLSYKILHLLEYLVGSLSLYFLLKRKGIGLLGFVAANAIFYFNTFFINHQIHFNIIMAFYLIPTAFLLADLFIEKRQFRYILLQSLVLANAVLWGHMQSAVILGMGIFLYMTVFSFKKMRLPTFLFYFTFLILFTAIETLPQIVPTLELFSQSRRSDSLDYLKGSLNPRMVIFSFVPYLIGGHDNFLGLQINKNNEFTYSEIYTYFGISSMILSFLALLLLKKSREIILAFVFIWIFLIFGFMDYNKLFPDYTPLITLFREWGRTAVLSSFGIALLVGIMIEKISEVSYKNIRRGILFVLSPLAYILILIKFDDGKIERKISAYTSYQYIQAYPYFHILEMIVLVLMVVLLLFFIIKKWYPRFSIKTLLAVKIILIVIVFFDLIYFSKDVLDFRLQDISNYKIASIPAELENKRAILNSTFVWGMESLYYSNWSPMGCSQLKEKDYVDYYDDMGISLKGVPTSFTSLPPAANYPKLKAAGIVAVSDVNGINYLNNSELDLIKNDVAGHYIKKKEGHIIMQINNPENTVINTYLKYTPYWKVRIDGKETKINKNGIFFDFPLSKGNHLVEIKYFPWPFFKGIFLSFLLLIITIPAYCLFRKYLLKK